jgi:excisionase family DNA binding protein
MPKPRRELKPEEKPELKPEDRRAFTVKEFCNAYRVSRSLAYKLMADQKLRSVLVGGKRLIPVEAAAELMSGDAQ